MLAYGKNMGYWLEKGIYNDKWGNNAHELQECNEGTGVLQNAPTRRLTSESIKAFILLWIEAAFTQNFTPKNYTYPSLEGITG